MEKRKKIKFEIEGYERTKRFVKAGGMGFAYVELPHRFRNKNVEVVLLDDMTNFEKESEYIKRNL